MKNIKRDSEILTLSLKLFDQAFKNNLQRDREIQQGIEGERKHAKEVLRWVKKLDKNPSLQLKIAALFHDIDRVITPGVGSGFKGSRKSEAYLLHKKAHAKRSAEYITKKLSKMQIDPKMVDRIKFLIKHHDDTIKEIEKFKDKELEILVAADSFSWFTTTGLAIYGAEGEKRAKDKLKFMINKLPKFAKRILRTLPIKNKNIDRLKNKALGELGIT